ncbi:MAG: PDZ domain-containing protein, partial [Pyrinomonadaceae bacterium]
MRNRLHLILGGLFFALMLAYAGANAYLGFEARQNSIGWAPAPGDGRVLVELVTPEGPAAGLLRARDEVVAINGREIRGYAQVSALLRLAPGTAYTLTVRREGETRDFTLRTTPIAPFAATMRVMLSVVLPAIFLVVGFAVFVLKPFDKQALLLALMFGTFVFITAEDQFIPDARYPWWLAGILVAGGAVSCLFAAVLFHFFLVFPEPSPALRRWPRLEFYLYVPHVLVTMPFIALAIFVMVTEPEEILAFQQKYVAAGLAVTALFAVYIGGGIVSLLVNYRQAGRWARRKMRVAVAGSVAGFTPLLTLIGLGFLATRVEISPSVFRWLGAVSVVAFSLFPLSFAYAIVRYQVIPVRLIIRRGIRYVFVSRGSKVLEVLAVGVALFLFLSYLFEYARPSPLVSGVVSGVVSVLVWNVTSHLHHRVIAPAIDRRFFRRAYSAQQVLSELGQELRVTADIRAMTSLVCTKMQDALQTENVSVFLRDDATGEYPCAVSSHHIGPERVTITAEKGLLLPRDAFVVQRLRESSHPLAVDFHDPQSWAHFLLAADTGANAARRRESESLQGVNAALLLPIA